MTVEALDRIGPYRAGCAINKHFLFALDICFSQTTQGGHPPTRQGGSFLIGDIGRFEGQRPLHLFGLLGQTDVLGVGAVPGDTGLGTAAGRKQER